MKRYILLLALIISCSAIKPSFGLVQTFQSIPSSGTIDYLPVSKKGYIQAWYRAIPLGSDEATYRDRIVNIAKAVGAQGVSVTAMAHHFMNDWEYDNLIVSFVERLRNEGFKVTVEISCTNLLDDAQIIRACEVPGIERVMYDLNYYPTGLSEAPPSPEEGWTIEERESSLKHFKDVVSSYGLAAGYYHGDSFGDTGMRQFGEPEVDAKAMSDYGLWVVGWHWHGLPDAWAWQPGRWDIDHIVVMYGLYGPRQADEFHPVTTRQDLLDWYEGTKAVSGGNYDFILYNLDTADFDPNTEQIEGMAEVFSRETQ